MNAEVEPNTPTNRSLIRRLVGLGFRIAGIGVLLSVTLTLPLRWVNPPTTAFILFDSVERQGSREWVRFHDVAPALPLAIVAAEDQKFPQHQGFDIEAITDALSDSGTRGRGASTISQQLAKNLYLWSGRSLFRKGLEAYFATLLELFLPKERILEVYINVVEFGPGVFGIGAASREYFGKTASRLSVREATLLAAVLPNPKRRSVTRPSAYVGRRASDIQRMMGQLGTEYLRDL